MACVGGGSNAIGLFSAYLRSRVALYGVEAGGRGTGPGQHAARFAGGSVGVLHGTRTMLLQDAAGQILATHSVSAGLDYPAVGPEHAQLHDSGRVDVHESVGREALEAFALLCETEGILPALESAHAVAFAAELARTLPRSRWILVNLSGRGDKDLDEVPALRSGTPPNDAASPRPSRARAAERRAAFVAYVTAGDPSTERHGRLWPVGSNGPAPKCWSSACRSPIRSPTVRCCSARRSRALGRRNHARKRLRDRAADPRRRRAWLSSSFPTSIPSMRFGVARADRRAGCGEPASTACC